MGRLGQMAEGRTKTDGNSRSHDRTSSCPQLDNSRHCPAEGSSQDFCRTAAGTTFPSKSIVTGPRDRLRSVSSGLTSRPTFAVRRAADSPFALMILLARTAKSLREDLAPG